MTDRERLQQMRIAWGQRRDWTADPMEGLRQIKRLERELEKKGQAS